MPTAESVHRRPTFVSEVSNELAGFYQLNIAAPRAELEHLWVHPGFMRQGVGTLLLAHAVEYLAHSGIAFLEIDSDPNAEPFYIACGAVHSGSRPAPIKGAPHRTRPQLRLATGAT
jgi:GNAT superfamily N-acetyltransferase